MASLVGPAVTKTFFPLSGRGILKIPRIPFIISPISGNLPSPSWRLASRPSSGSIITFPRFRSFSTASWVAGFCHIRKFMAGANNVGCSQTDRVVETSSSATPLATLQRILAVAGTTATASKSIAS